MHRNFKLNTFYVHCMYIKTIIAKVSKKSYNIGTINNKCRKLKLMLILPIINLI